MSRAECDACSVTFSTWNAYPACPKCGETECVSLMLDAPEEGESRAWGVTREILKDIDEEVLEELSDQLIEDAKNRLPIPPQHPHIEMRHSFVPIDEERDSR